MKSKNKVARVVRNKLYTSFKRDEKIKSIRNLFPLNSYDANQLILFIKMY